ncbi:hypothetical protein FRAAL1719 [Frankia alni ACN14a]|uniref:Uncharacterized protein n=1 Tax=Frankia alni (strain DSM 45986 / CECT 9034 / ACN14a) TaxID=326424 RepID=Q0RQ06_FRAAA|nr:hypothetical protein FRAAL1719 [Frankia alni ACN14a]
MFQRTSLRSTTRVRPERRGHLSGLFPYRFGDSMEGI